MPGMCSFTRSHPISTVWIHMPPSATGNALQDDWLLRLSQHYDSECWTTYSLTNCVRIVNPLHFPSLSQSSAHHTLWTFTTCQCLLWPCVSSSLAADRLIPANHSQGIKSWEPMRRLLGRCASQCQFNMNVYVPAGGLWKRIRDVEKSKKITQCPSKAIQRNSNSATQLRVC